MVKQRCEWIGSNELMKKYHDEEWGVPLYDDQKLFEFLCLEGMQAGLSWQTILNKREEFRNVFDNFDPVKISEYDQQKIVHLLANKGIIRNKLKINAVISNAKLYLDIVKDRSFSEYLWSFVNGKPKINQFKSLRDLPAKTKESELMSKTLKKAGFKFVGPTICYAFMQATGMVNDHIISCFRYKELT